VEKEFDLMGKMLCMRELMILKPRKHLSFVGTVVMDSEESNGKDHQSCCYGIYNDGLSLHLTGPARESTRLEDNNYLKSTKKVKWSKWG
jgi:hypothetical protein